MKKNTLTRRGKLDILLHILERQVEHPNTKIECGKSELLGISKVKKYALRKVLDELKKPRRVNFKCPIYYWGHDENLNPKLFVRKPKVDTRTSLIKESNNLMYSLPSNWNKHTFLLTIVKLFELYKNVSKESKDRYEQRFYSMMDNIPNDGGIPDEERIIFYKAVHYLEEQHDKKEFLKKKSSKQIEIKDSIARQFIFLIELRQDEEVTSYLKELRKLLDPLVAKMKDRRSRKAIKEVLDHHTFLYNGVFLKSSRDCLEEYKKLIGELSTGSTKMKRYLKISKGLYSAVENGRVESSHAILKLSDLSQSPSTLPKYNQKEEVKPVS